MEIPRKIQLTGRNTYILSLPHDWVTRQSISKGDAIYVKDNEDGTLTLSLQAMKKESKTCTINVSGASDETSMRNIVSAYVGGAGKIILQGKGTYTLAEEARRVLSGVEITEENGEELILRILAFEDVQIDSIIKREFNVTQSMFGLAVSAYSDGADVFTEISRKEDEVDRLYLLLLRTLCIGGYASRESVFKGIAAKSIEKVSDHLEDICVSGRTSCPNQLISGLLERSAAIYSAAYQAFSKMELDRGSFSDAKKDYLAEFSKVDSVLKKEKDASKMLALRSLCEKCSKVLRYSEDIMESSSDMVFAQMKAEDHEASVPRAATGRVYK